jgi:UDP-N-acetylglucosamine--N-acetylmuramyl-(pentapeptide) pyrophosphoryl-undecaprenol N-acetylglucosamine transferase
MRVLIAGGGTGGHVIPALAIARELRDSHGAEVRFVGTARGLETRLVPEGGFPLELIQVGQLKNVSLATRVRTLADLPLGVMRCVGLVRSFRPDVVVGVGGYASGPAMMAAILLRVPTLAFEPNAVPGLANRLVGRWVNAAAVNFEETRKYFRGARVTGIPVRREFFAIGELPSKDVPSRTVQLLVFGGSQGARIFNEVMPRIAKRLMEEVPGLRILHQAGAKFAEPVEAAYGASGADATRWEVSAFLDDMPRRFADADLILCRSGASTVAELAAAGKAAVLVPLPTAADNHQLKNAEVFAAAGAAELRVQRSDAAMESFLSSDLAALLLDSARRREMSRKVRGLAHPDAVRVIGEMAVGLVRARG